MARYDLESIPHPVARSTDGLELRAATDPDDPLLENFFAEYDRAFVLPDEKEEIAGFRDCLALNLPPAYPRLAARYGPFREFVALAVDTGGGTETVVGGANFICYPLETGSGGHVLTMNLNYVFVLPKYRRRGYLGRILAACERLARMTFRPADGAKAPDELPLYIFMELNDPLRLAPAAYARDTLHSGMDQLQRVAVWARMGARIIDFPYVQPPLSAVQAADPTLMLALIGPGETDEVAPSLLAAHLVRFFAISVLKGREPQEDADASAQLTSLAALAQQGRRVALLEAGAWLAAQRDTDAGALRHWGSLRAALAAYGKYAEAGPTGADHV